MSRFLSLHLGCTLRCLFLLSSCRVSACVAVALVCAFCIAPLAAQTSFRLGGGVSTTYDNLSSALSGQALSGATVTGGGGAWSLVSELPLIGWHGSARLMLPLADRVGFTLAGAYHQFGTARVDVLDVSRPSMPTVRLGDMRITQTMIPIAAGLEYSLVRLGIGLYIMGEISYNLFTSSAEGMPVQLTQAGLAVRESFGRAGGSVGVGADLLIGGIGIDVAVRYHHTNLIGRPTSEREQAFFSLTASLLLGTK